MTGDELIAPQRLLRHRIALFTRQNRVARPEDARRTLPAEQPRLERFEVTDEVIWRFFFLIVDDFYLIEPVVSHD